MRSDRWLTTLVVLVLASVPWRAVPAQGVVDVVIRVQVNFSPPGGDYTDSVGVSCTAKATTQPSNKVTGNTRLPLVGSNYSGNVDVTLRLTPSQIGEMWSYQCGLMQYSELYNGWRVAGTDTWPGVGGQTSYIAYGEVQAY